ncbi:hypothetical protein BH23CHL5_BH23CHL5_08930 [soil metagenome]
MNQCPNCGNEIRATARFCTSCGFRMPERFAEPHVQTGSGSPYAPGAAGWGSRPDVSVAVAQTESESENENDSRHENSVESPDVRETPESVPVTPDDALQVVSDVLPVATPLPTGPVPNVVAEETINDIAENRVNIALFHIERLRQLVPDITGWSEQQAESVDKAVTALETALKGREEAESPYESLRETLKAVKRDSRDIDVMIALADRAAEIEDVIAAHDDYSQGVREALLAIKPAAVNYVKEIQKRPARKRPARKSPAKKPAEPKLAAAPTTESSGSKASPETAETKPDSQ